MQRICFALAMLLAPVLARAEDLSVCEQAVKALVANNFDLAIDNYTRCLDGSLSPIDRGVALANRALAYARKNQTDAAMADYETSIRLMPDFWPGYSGRGSIFERKGDLDS